MSSLSPLVDALIPPAAPVCARGSWSAVERALGASLPTDYKSFVETFGAGTIGASVRVLVPFSRADGWLARAIDATAASAAVADVVAPTFARFPTRGGLLLFGYGGGGQELSWITEGAADDWCIHVASPRDGREDLFPGGLTTFLHELLTRAYACPILEAPEATFEPCAEAS